MKELDLRIIGTRLPQRINSDLDLSKIPMCTAKYFSGNRIGKGYYVSSSDWFLNPNGIFIQTENEVKDVKETDNETFIFFDDILADEDNPWVMRLSDLELLLEINQNEEIFKIL